MVREGRSQEYWPSLMFEVYLAPSLHRKDSTAGGNGGERFGIVRTDR